jgi:hypothetical protein
MAKLAEMIPNRANAYAKALARDGITRMLATIQLTIPEWSWRSCMNSKCRIILWKHLRMQEGCWRFGRALGKAVLGVKHRIAVLYD